MRPCCNNKHHRGTKISKIEEKRERANEGEEDYDRDMERDRLREKPQFVWQRHWSQARIFCCTKGQIRAQFYTTIINKKSPTTGE